MCTAKPTSRRTIFSWLSPSKSEILPASRSTTPKKFSQLRLCCGAVGRLTTGTIRFQLAWISAIGSGGASGGGSCRKALSRVISSSVTSPLVPKFGMPRGVPWRSSAPRPSVPIHFERSSPMFGPVAPVR